MRSIRKAARQIRKTATQRSIVIGGIFLVLALAGTYLLQAEIDIGGAKEQIVAEASSQLKEKVAIEHATFCLVPSPHITLSGVRIEPSPWGDFAAGEIRLHVRLLPLLLKKKLVIKKISMQGAVLNLVVRKESKVWGENILRYIENEVLRVIPSLALTGGQVNILKPAGEVPFFTFTELNGSLDARGQGKFRLALSFACPGAEKIEIRIARRRADAPRPSCSLLAVGTGITVEPLREVILDLFGKNETVQTVFSIIQGGRLSRLSFEGAGKDFTEALDFERAVRVSGTFTNGKILAPPAALPLEDAAGSFAIEEAVLHCSGVDLRLGKSIGTKGDLVVGLIRKREAFHLEVVLDAAAEDLVRYLPLVIKDNALIRELENFRDPQGRGKGRLVLGDSINNIYPIIDVKSFRLSFRHVASPGVISVEGGRLALKKDKGTWQADTVTWKKLRWTNAAGGVTLRNQGINITVAKADLCGLRCQGNMDSHAGIVTHAYRIGVEKGDLASAIRCMWGVEATLEGQFRLEGDMWAEGHEDPLREASEGLVAFTSHNGRIERWTLLSQLFGTLNIIGLLQGDHPEYTKKGFQYDTFVITGELRNGNLYLKEAVIDAHSMKIVGEGKIDLVKGEADMVVLVAPLKTIDTIMNHIPVLGRIFTGKNGLFVSVAFRVKGPLDNPTITPLPAEAVGSGLWGMLKRILQSPLDIYKSVAPKKSSR
jgi:hypothetical protein